MCLIFSNSQSKINISKIALYGLSWGVFRVVLGSGSRRGACWLPLWLGYSWRCCVCFESFYSCLCRFVRRFSAWGFASCGAFVVGAGWSVSSAFFACRHRLSLPFSRVVSRPVPAFFALSGVVAVFCRGLSSFVLPRCPLLAFFVCLSCCLFYGRVWLVCSAAPCSCRLPTPLFKFLTQQVGFFILVFDGIFLELFLLPLVGKERVVERSSLLESLRVCVRRISSVYLLDS